MKTQLQKLEYFDQKAAKLTQERDATQKLIEDFPQELPQDVRLIVYHNSKLCEFGLHYEAKSTEEVLNIIEGWREYVSDLYYQKKTFTSFKAEWHELDDSAVQVEPVTVDVSKWGVEFKFYASFPGHTIRVTIKLDGGLSLACPQWILGESNRKIGTRLINTGFNNPEYVKWASGDNQTMNTFTLYWWHGSFEDLSGMFVK